MSEKLAAIVREDEERARAAGREPRPSAEPTPPSRRRGHAVSDRRRRSPTPTEPVEPSSTRRSSARATCCATPQRILLTSHRRPDGDGTGSMAGLASLLRARGKTR